jgi:hypothetical protein
MSSSSRPEERVLVYDHLGGEGDFAVDREPVESDKSYYGRTALYKKLFRHRQDSFIAGSLQTEGQS